MTKIKAWFQQQRFRSDVKHLQKRLSDPEGRLTALTHYLGWLAKCTFERSALTRAQGDLTFMSQAGNCDELLLALREAGEVLSDRKSDYSSMPYARRERSEVTLSEYLVTNAGILVSPQLFADKFKVLITPMLDDLLVAVVSSDGREQYHLRSTSRLVEECLDICLMLLAISDQQLIPPSA